MKDINSPKIICVCFTEIIPISIRSYTIFLNHLFSMWSTELAFSISPTSSSAPGEISRAAFPFKCLFYDQKMQRVSFVPVSSHLPVYLVAAFVKRLARLALTAPPTALLMVLPFVYNLIRRHPSCRILIHKPSTEDGERQPDVCLCLYSISRCVSD